ncbi:MAG: hypothetical protein JWO95_1532 [Verrucomicrobiales bacterium]|nr:hypothetical protein [Verrucomicrobiales bacterium]
METSRPSMQEIGRVRRLIGNNPESNAMVLRFIAHQYGVTSLADLPAKVVRAICKRPAAFARAVKQHCETHLLQ